MKIDFKEYFSSEILSRGYDYWKKGLIRNVCINGSNITAKVCGSEVYEVDAEIVDGMLRDASCDCPYNSTGTYCKHIAALMYYLENKKDLDGKGNISLKDIINKISEKEIREYIYDILKEDNKLYEDFRQKFIDKFPKLSKKDYEKRIYDSISNCVNDRYGFIDYSGSYKYEHTMDKYLDEAEDFVNKNDFDTAFMIVSIILESIPKTEIDDSNGSTGSVSCRGIEILENIIRNNDEGDMITKNIFDYVIHELDTGYLEDYNIELSELLKVYIEKKIYLDKIEEVLINILDKDKDEEFSYRREYYISLICRIYEIKNKVNKQMDLLKEYSFDRNICMMYVDKLIEQNMVEKAINVLKEGIGGKNYTSKVYAEKLKEIYIRYNRNEEYKEILYKIFYEYTNFEFETYLEIKKLYSEEEWDKERTIIIDRVRKSSENSSILINIYEEEKMIDELFDGVCNMGTECICRYEYLLLPKYNQELIKIYCINILNIVSRCSNRNEYSKLARQVKHIINMKDSDKTVKFLFDEIKNSYLKRRPAMLDEFKKVIKNVDKYIN